MGLLVALTGVGIWLFLPKLPNRLRLMALLSNFQTVGDTVSFSVPPTL